MAFGKSNKPKRRHRPVKVEVEAEEVHPEIVREKRRERLNAPIIGTVITVVGSIMMFVIALMGAPYTYGSSQVFYSPKNIEEAERLADAGRTEREAADPKLLVDFSTVILSPRMVDTDAMAKVATICRQSGGKALSRVQPKDLHRTYRKATRFLSCAMATAPQRFCDPAERKTLVDQLTAYGELREFVLGFEDYRDEAVAKREQVRKYQLEIGQDLSPLLTLHTETLGEDLDPTVRRNIETLVRNGYLDASDFGYLGFYVPRIYGDTLRIGADRSPYCPQQS